MFHWNHLFFEHDEKGYEMNTLYAPSKQPSVSRQTWNTYITIMKMKFFPQQINFLKKIRIGCFLTPIVAPSFVVLLLAAVIRKTSAPFIVPQYPVAGKKKIDTPAFSLVLLFSPSSVY
jgi:hypothetical protein